MKQNLLVLSYDYSLSKRISKKLAEIFSMRELDQFELFEFDHIPRNFDEVLEIEGDAYIMKKFRSIIKMELDFDNVAFTANINCADNCEELFYKMKLSNFVILLYKPIEIELSELDNVSYKTDKQKEFFKTDKQTLQNREEKIRQGCADISINIEDLSDDKIVELIIDLINAYYSVS